MKSSSFATSQQGTNYGDFLLRIGKGTKEYGTLDWDEKLFWKSWYNKKMDRLRREAEK